MRKLTIALAFLALALALAFIALIVWRPPTDSAQVAAWLQAVASAVAIVAAFEIGSAQAKTALDLQTAQQKEARSDAILQARAVVSRLGYLVIKYAAYLKAWPRGTALNVDPHELAEALPIADQTLTVRMPPECVESVLEVRAAMASLIGIMRRQQGALIYGHSHVQESIAAAEADSIRALDRLNDAVGCPPGERLALALLDRDKPGRPGSFVVG